MLQSTNGLTANYNNYSADALEKSLQSWVEPYPKPIILNHDLNSEPIGRVIAAKMDKEADGSPYIRLQIAVTDPQAAQKISDQRYLTGSVGGRAGRAICSISGEDLAAETADGRPKPAKYKRGQVYKGKLAFADMQDISFKEYSFVNQPADQRSSVRTSKTIDGSTSINDSDTWTAKSTAFILHMDKEDITTVEENESIFKNLKKKESRPLYLHLKGSFLTALAFQESETAKADDIALLSRNMIIDNEENLSMDETIQSEDVLAAVENLSQDLSTIAATSVESTIDSSVQTAQVEVVDAAEQEAPTEPAEELEKIDNTGSKEIAVATEEQQVEQEVVDSVDAEIPAEMEEQEESKVELTDEVKADEQDANDEVNKLQALQEENAKLKEALHRTLVERVVDTKISLGIESVESREELIIDHVKRSAGSLADSLRDLAKLPVVKKNIQKLNESIIENDIVLEEENNVILEDEEVQTAPQAKVDTVEELFVDALMGRRKL